ncbi:hypothetical protein HMN09_00754000 [Mycena chlorophos]|uniref:Uncharacterized protein n=1 Tax=Mycena chlorophos TaxID=658473 RepID=A0A8H6SY06_MYCCL|nr:hypothetical protein HMN09_00754000 [Mycena chlorophos]
MNPFSLLQNTITSRDGPRLASGRRSCQHALDACTAQRVSLSLHAPSAFQMSTLAPSQVTEAQAVGTQVIYFLSSLLAQTCIFGIYTVLFGLSTRMLLKRKLRTTVNRVMFGLTVFMYLLSTAYWLYSAAYTVDRLRQLTALATQPGLTLPDHTAVSMWSPLMDSIIGINCVVSDCVVVWRAWVICLRHHRRYMWVSIFFLICSAISQGIWIVFRIIGTAISPKVNLNTTTGLGRGINIIEGVIVFTSTLSNLCATGVVSATAYRHLRTQQAAFSESSNSTSSSRTNQILVLIIETGAAYTFVAASRLIATIGVFVRLPQGTLNDLYLPVLVEIAGAYPSIVLLLVSTQKDSLSDSNLPETPFSQPIVFRHMMSGDDGDIELESGTVSAIGFAPNRSYVGSSPDLKPELEGPVQLTP